MKHQLIMPTAAVYRSTIMKHLTCHLCGNLIYDPLCIRIRKKKKKTLTKTVAFNVKPETYFIIRFDAFRLLAELISNTCDHQQHI